MQPFTFPIDSALSALIKKVTRQFGKFRVETFTVYPTSNVIDRTTGQYKIIRHGPDDHTYHAYPALVPLVPRGCSDLYYRDQLVAQVRGPEKFSGTSSIDEDDALFEGATEADTVSNKNLIDFDKVRQWEKADELLVQFQEKANGKFAICTVFEVNGDCCVFGGSKNVHVPLSLEDDNSGSELHFAILRRMIYDIRQTADLQSLKGRMLVGEYCDGKHLVYTPKTYMVYFDTTLPANFRKPLDVAPSSTSMPSNATLNEIRRLTKIEGVVINYVNTRTGQRYRQKHKSSWYVVLRCWREIISKCHKGEKSQDALISLLMRRLQTRSDEFLHLPAEDLREWKRVAEVFVARLTASKFAYRDVSPFSDIGMAQVWYNLMENYTESSAEQSTPVAATVRTVLVHPEYYDCVLSAAEILPTLVIMSGLPGSGKSTIAKELVADLVSRNLKGEIFSTDSFFLNGKGQYCFDPKLLGVNHAKNLAAALASKARVVIIDNTNLSPTEYAKYQAGMRDRLCIVLTCKLDPIDVLAARNTHGVPTSSLVRMATRYTVAVPAYIGLFPSPSQMGPWEKLIRQVQPSHITELFIGGASSKNKAVDPTMLGENVVVKVTGISTNTAGIALVCEGGSGTKPHITLAVNVQCKAVQVGQQVTPINTVGCTPMKLTCIRLPMF